MMTGMRDAVLNQFRRFRRRERWVRGMDLFLEAAFVMTVAAAGMLLADRLAFETGLMAPHLSLPDRIAGIMGATLGLAALYAGVTLALRPTPPARIARRLDLSAGGEERFLSALELAAENAGGPFTDALCADAVRMARGAEPARALPRVPVGYRWGVALSVAAAGILLAFPPRLYDPPTANFEATPLRGPAPLEVTFVDASIGAIDTFEWDFGDGITGSGQSLSHLFETPGRYPVRLALHGPGGSSERVREVIVLPADRPAAEFEAEPEKGRAPLEVRFRNLSFNATGYTWDFGDGATSGEVEPAHRYLKPGRYTVRLEARNALGTDVRVREEYIKVVGPDGPLADFRAVPRKGPAPLAVDFEDRSTGGIDTWTWDFGDPRSGSSDRSERRNPSHVYTAPGRYPVRLTVKGPNGEDLEEKLHYIHVTSDGGGGGGGGSLAGGGLKTPKTRSGAGDKPGQTFGDKSERPKTRVIPEGVTPHTSGGPLTEKTRVFGKSPEGGTGAAEVPLTSVFREYRRAMEDSMARERIPPASRGAVRRYFESIAPGEK